MNLIHRASRHALAEALRHYLSGRITNDDLDGVEVDWRDRGAVAVKEMAWCLYDDLKRHYVEDRFPRHSEARSDISRWIVFLHSDEEYTWPDYSLIQTERDRSLINLFTFGWWEKRKKMKWEEFLEAGDFDVWPFCSRSDLERVMKHPKLLSGAPPTS